MTRTIHKKKTILGGSFRNPLYFRFVSEFIPSYLRLISVKMPIFPYAFRKFPHNKARNSLIRRRTPSWPETPTRIVLKFLAIFVLKFLTVHDTQKSIFHCSFIHENYFRDEFWLFLRASGKFPVGKLPVSRKLYQLCRYLMFMNHFSAFLPIKIKLSQKISH